MTPRNFAAFFAKEEANKATNFLRCREAALLQFTTSAGRSFFSCRNQAAEIKEGNNMYLEMRAMDKANLEVSRFERNSDGQFVGKIIFAGKETKCWLVYDEDYALKDGAFLRLSFENPYPQRARMLSEWYTREPHWKTFIRRLAYMMGWRI